MPSLLTLFLVTRLSAGVIFAGNYLFTPSEPVVKPTPTRTTAIFLEPTPCLPSPTSSDAQFPYVVMFGLATVVVASVAFTIWSTFKGVRHPPTAAVPPEPDTEFDTEPDITPRDRTRLLSFLFAFFMTICAYVSTLSPTKTPDSLFFGITILGLVQTVDNQIQYGLGLMQHLHDYGLHYLKIALLAIVGQSVGLLVAFLHRRVLSSIYRRREYLIDVALDYLPEIIIILIPSMLFAFHPQLDWAIWSQYYVFWADFHLPSLRQIHQAVVLLLPSVPINTVAMIAGPSAFYFMMAALWTTALCLACVPTMTRMVFEEVYDMRSYLPHMCRKSCTVFTILFCGATFQFGLFEALRMGPIGKDGLQTLATQVLSSAAAPAKVWEFYRQPRDRHYAWRINQTKAFDDLKGLLWSTVCSTWEALPWAQKMLIIAPVVTVFVHFYLMPWMMPRLRYFRIWLTIEYEMYQRRQHSCVPLITYKTWLRIG